MEHLRDFLADPEVQAELRRLLAKKTARFAETLLPSSLGSPQESHELLVDARARREEWDLLAQNPVRIFYGDR